MDPELSAQEIEDLLAAYAIDAVDDDERVVVEQYVASHPEADAEVQAFRHAAAMLAYTGGPVPDGVWDSLAPALAERRRRVEAAAGVVPLPSRRPQSEPKPDSPTAPGAHRMRWLAAAAVAAVLLIGGVVAAVVATGDGGGSSSQQQLADAARAARTQPGARTVTLQSADGRALGDVTVLPNGRAYLTSDLPALDGGRTYQLWALHGTDRVNLGVIGRDPHVVAFRIPGNPSGIAVTNEVSGGVKVSHKDPVAVGIMQTA
jgi:anti-sigma-K factor RskA